MSLFVKNIVSQFSPPVLSPSAPIHFMTISYNKSNEKEQNEERKKYPANLAPSFVIPVLSPVLSSWYFWLFIAMIVITIMASCGYWRRRKIYESSASQTISNNHIFPSITPSDHSPVEGPPLPFLPPVAYPAPPPYLEAIRPSFDRSNHLQIYESLVKGRSVYDFYDRRHPNAYYDRYFLKDDTSSSETTSLLSCHLQRPCHAQISKYPAIRNNSDKPPPYSEVAAKPDLYPVVMVNGSTSQSSTVYKMKNKKMKNELTQCQTNWLPYYHCRAYRSGSMSTTDGSQASTTAGAYAQNITEWWRNQRGTVSPATLLASCSGMPSPASSSGPLPSEVSSLDPTSPPSPPAPLSPTLNLAFQSQSIREMKDVFHKISQLPRASSPSTADNFSCVGSSPGGMLSPFALSPGASPGANSYEEELVNDSSYSWRMHPVPQSNSVETTSYDDPASECDQFSPRKQNLLSSLSLDPSPSLKRPRSLYIKSNKNPSQIQPSTSTPNIALEWLKQINKVDLYATFKDSTIFNRPNSKSVVNQLQEIDKTYFLWPNRASVNKV